MGLWELLLLTGGSSAVASAAWIAFRRVRRGSAYDEWRILLDTVARQVGGRVSAPSPSEAPQLRADFEGQTVTLTLANFAADPSRMEAHAQVNLPRNDNLVRLYVGWDAPHPPADFEHVPQAIVTPPPGLDGELTLRSEDATVAKRFLEGAALDLLDVRRETEARSLEVRVRGGYLTLTTQGTRPTAPMLERALRVAHRLSVEIHAASNPSGNDGARHG